MASLEKSNHLEEHEYPLVVGDLLSLKEGVLDMESLTEDFDRKFTPEEMSLYAGMRWGNATFGEGVDDIG